MFTEMIEMRGHIIDSLILPRVLDIIMDIGGDFEIEEMIVGRTKTDVSIARVKIIAPTQEMGEQIIDHVQRLGAIVLRMIEIHTKPAPRDGVFPLDFYSTTNLRTEIYYQSQWIPVTKTEMDCGIIIDSANAQASCIAVTDVKAGDLIAVGHEGIKVEPLQRSREKEVFAFMNSAVSTERPKELVLAQLAVEMREIRAHGGNIIVVGGPAIIHTGAGPHLTRLIAAGYVQKLFAGNALATHDVESALYGTSLGTSLASGNSVEEGHQHHIRAINHIRYLGGLREAVAQGVLTSGVMHACIVHNVDYVLAGSIRDDGPLPDVITDVVEAQREMRKHLEGAEMVLLIASMLHSIAVGNLLPAYVRSVAVDINPSTVTKLADRGTAQTLNLVTDVESFLRELCAKLGV